MELKIPVQKGQNIKAMLTLLNCFLGNLTKTELNIISTMVSSDLTILNQDTRVELRELVDMNKHSFNNYIKILKDKNILYLDDNKFYNLNPKILELLKDNKVIVEFIEQ